MGGLKKKQHYVPRFYLKFFAGLDNKFYAYDLNSNRIIPDRVHYESQCYKKYFYGEDGVLEEHLSMKEGEWANVCKKAIHGDVLNDVDIMLLKEFVIYQKQRTNDNNKHRIEERESILREYVRQLYCCKGWEFDDVAEKFCQQRAEEEVTPAENVYVASRMLKYVEDLDILIVRYSTENRLLTTDSPVVTLNAFMKFQGHGYDSLGVVFLMPLAPSVLLVLYDGQLYKRYNGSIYVNSSCEEEVLNINRYGIIHAEKMFYSDNILNINLVTNEVMEYRNREEKRNKTQFLGPEGSQRLIISNIEGTDYYYEIPYAILPRDYRRIPFHCREAVPRHFEKGWEKKLAIKYQVLYMAKNKLSDEIIKRQIPSKTDLKIGCRRMESLAIKYWRDKGYNL